MNTVITCFGVTGLATITPCGVQGLLLLGFQGTGHDDGLWLNERALFDVYVPEGPSTQYLRTLVPKPYP